jgi:hypothetical protein
MKAKFQIGEIVKDPEKYKCVIMDRFGHGRYKVRYFYNEACDLLDPYSVNTFSTKQLKTTNRLFKLYWHYNW